jgi:hypothetical protein
MMVPDGLNVCYRLNQCTFNLTLTSLLQSDGELVQTAVPRPMEIENYIQHGLAVEAGVARSLEFMESWSQKAVDQWLRDMLPKPFEWLDARFGLPDVENGEVHWVLLQRDQRRLFVVERNPTTGAELSRAKGTAARNPAQWNVRIGWSIYGTVP